MMMMMMMRMVASEGSAEMVTGLSDTSGIHGGSTSSCIKCGFGLPFRGDALFPTHYVMLWSTLARAYAARKMCKLRHPHHELRQFKPPPTPPGHSSLELIYFSGEVIFREVGRLSLREQLARAIVSGVETTTCGGTK